MFYQEWQNIQLSPGSLSASVKRLSLIHIYNEEKSVSPKVVYWLQRFSKNACICPGGREAGINVSKCSLNVTSPALSSFRMTTYERTREKCIGC